MYIIYAFQLKLENEPSDNRLLRVITDTIRQIPVELRRADIKYALEIAVKFGIYAYDAYFLECASGLRCPLITLDRGMKGVALEMGIPILE